jgi:hypothetical protein
MGISYTETVELFAWCLMNLEGSWYVKCHLVAGGHAFSFAFSDPADRVRFETRRREGK